jgi:hypothetical protein
MMGSDSGFYVAGCCLASRLPAEIVADCRLASP